MTENKEVKKATAHHVSDVILLQLTLFYVCKGSKEAERRDEQGGTEERREKEERQE